MEDAKRDAITMKHNTKKDTMPLTNVIDRFYRSVVNNSGSRTLSLSSILKDWNFVKVEVIEEKNDSVTIRISEVKE